MQRLVLGEISSSFYAKVVTSAHGDEDEGRRKPPYCEEFRLPHLVSFRVESRDVAYRST